MRTDSTPTGLVHEAYWSMFWQAHPYRWPVLGWMSDIDQYRLADAQAYYDTHYSPENCTAIFVGDVDVAAVQALARRYFGRLKRFEGDRPEIVTVEPDQPAERRMAARADANDEITIRWHGPPAVHRDAPACDLLLGAFAGRSGRLFLPLVEEKKLALDVDAWYWGMKYGGVVNLGLTPREGVDFAAAEQALLAIVDEVREKGVADREIRKARNQMLADLVRGLRTNEGIARQLGYFETVGTWHDFMAYAKGLETATAEDVKRCAQTYLRPTGRNVLHIQRRSK